MTTFICPRCRTHVGVPSYISDFEHNCGAARPESKVLGYEDVVKYGNWQDDSTILATSGTYAGSVIPDAQLANRQNLIVDRTAWKEARVVVHKLTARGNLAITTRQRPHLEFIEINKDAT